MASHTPETLRWFADTDDTDAYVERLRAALAHRKMSQAQFARIAGCSASNVSQILNHKQRYIHIGRVPKYIWRAALPLIAAMPIEVTSEVQE
jgi:predicted XRE-type DNA-binding protein